MTEPSMSAAPLLEIRNLSVAFDTDEGTVQAVDHISYTVDARESIAIVGESGSGKSVGAMAVIGLLPSPPARIGGEVLFQGRNLAALDDKALSAIRGREIGFIFQEPMTSLNPVLSIETQLCEGMERHLGLTRKQAATRAVDLLARVGISDPERRLKQYPHQFSGGMRQRVMIAMALSCEPKLIIADEPTTALDVTIQAQILRLMGELTSELGVSLILIAHDLGLVATYTQRMNVMYGGRIVESGPTRDVFLSPRHPYTRGLLASIPRLTGAREERLQPIPGQPPNLARLGAGCAFRPRCKHAKPPCAERRPDLQSTGKARNAACLYADELA